MKISKIALLMTSVLSACLLISSASADTFTRSDTNEVLHGYATSQTTGGKTTVKTLEKGSIELKLSQWQVTPNHLGRNKKVIVLTLNSQIMLDIETTALVEAIPKAADEGPLFILLQIDTPGGRTDYTHRICGAITQTKNCPVVAFIKDGKFGGAVSAGAAVAFACDKIYMAKNTTIGAATAITVSKTGPTDFKDKFGEVVGEKISSAWRTYLASLAEQNDRPGLLAGAMVDKDIEVIEVTDDQARLFIDPVNRTPQQQLIHMWSKKGSLLTLTADQAVKCQIADKVVSSRGQLLQDMNARDAEVVINNAIQEATRQLKRAKLRLNRITKSATVKIKQLEEARHKQIQIKLIREIIKDYKALISLAKRYPDLKLNAAIYQQQLNAAEGLYKQARMKR